MLKFRWYVLIVLALLVTACPTTPPTTTTIDVNGTVVGTSTGDPEAGANVLLNGGNLQTTGADGRFSYPDVTPPYTLTVKIDSKVYEYRGLTRPNPQLPGSVSYQATIIGKVTGPTYPLPAGEGIGIAFGGADFGFGTADPATGVYKAVAVWGTTPTTTTDLVAIRAKVTGGVIDDYLAMGKRTSIALNNGAMLSGIDIALTEPVPTTTTTLTYDLGAYATSGWGNIFSIKVGATFPMILSGAVWPSPSGTTLKLPAQGGSVIVQGVDANSNRALVVTPAVLGGTTHIMLPATTQLKNSLPVDGAVGVSKTPTLSWTPVSDVGLYWVVLDAPDPAVDYQWFLPTGSSLTIPDYSLLGATLTGSTSYTLGVQAYKGEGFSVDALTDPTGIHVGYVIYSKPSMTFYESAATSFTTAP